MHNPFNSIEISHIHSTDTYSILKTVQWSVHTLEIHCLCNWAIFKSIVLNSLKNKTYEYTNAVLSKTSEPSDEWNMRWCHMKSKVIFLDELISIFKPASCHLCAAVGVYDKIYPLT